MDTKVTDLGGVNIADYGRPEYLDGASMQFSVLVGALYPNGETIAYFDNEEDAMLFAKAKKRAMKARS